MKSGAWRSAPTASGLLRPASTRLVKVWDAQTGEVGVEFSGHTASVVFCVAWHPDGQRIASAGRDGQLHTVKVWDAQTGREVFELPAGPGTGRTSPWRSAPTAATWSRGKSNGAVQVWDAGTGQEVGTLGTHDREIRGVVFSRDGEHLASASGDGKVKLWDATRLTRAWTRSKNLATPSARGSPGRV